MAALDEIVGSTFADRPSPLPIRWFSDLATHVIVNLSGPLRAYSGGAASISVEADSVGESLRAMKRECPTVYTCLCDEAGAVRRHIGIFVNRTHVRELAGLDTPLARGDVLTIMTAVSGG